MSKEAEVRADRGFSISPGKSQGFLVAGLLALVAVLYAVWTTSGETAHAANRASQRNDLRARSPRRQRTRSWLSATHFARPRFRPTRIVKVHTATEFWHA